MIRYNNKQERTQQYHHHQQQHEAAPAAVGAVGENDDADEEVCHFTKESFAALDIRSRTKSWNSLSSTESAPGLTDCSSRSSLHDDLDLSIDNDYEEDGQDDDDDDDESLYMDAFSSPAEQRQQQIYLCGEVIRRDDKVGVEEQIYPYLPSVLRNQQRRSVSFSGIAEILGENETVVDTQQGVVPRTPTIHWYSSKGSNQHHQQPLLPPLPSSAHPPLSSGGTSRNNRTNATAAASRFHLPHPQLRPRRSALKKPSGETSSLHNHIGSFTVDGGVFSGSSSSSSSSPLNLFSPVPVSPNIRWYASKK